MRKWIILLAVIELAVLAMHLPGRRYFSFKAVAYPESLVRPVFHDGQYVKPDSADTGWADRATLGMAAYGVMTVCWLVALYWLGGTGGRLPRRTLIVVLVGSAYLARRTQDERGV